MSHDLTYADSWTADLIGAIRPFIDADDERHPPFVRISTPISFPRVPTVERMQTLVG
ncbi:hypothetical protein ACWCHM_11465 [Micromonospora sp. SCSIO 07396]